MSRTASLSRMTAASGISVATTPGRYANAPSQTIMLLPMPMPATYNKVAEGSPARGVQPIEMALDMCCGGRDGLNAQFAEAGVQQQEALDAAQLGRTTLFRYTPSRHTKSLCCA